MDKKIEIILNGFKEKVPESTSVASLLKIFDERDINVIVEHNGRFVYPQHYASTMVLEGDVLEFIHPDFGG
jgi:thiamine biosynthesis protein ThiS